MKRGHVQFQSTDRSSARSRNRNGCRNLHLGAADPSSHPMQKPAKYSQSSSSNSRGVDFPDHGDNDQARERQESPNRHHHHRAPRKIGQDTGPQVHHTGGNIRWGSRINIIGDPRRTKVYIASLLMIASSKLRAERILITYSVFIWVQDPT